MRQWGLAQQQAPTRRGASFGCLAIAHIAHVLVQGVMCHRPPGGLGLGEFRLSAISGFPVTCRGCSPLGFDGASRPPIPTCIGACTTSDMIVVVAHFGSGGSAIAIAKFAEKMASKRVAAAESALPHLIRKLFECSLSACPGSWLNIAQ